MSSSLFVLAPVVWVCFCFVLIEIDHKRVSLFFFSRWFLCSVRVAPLGPGPSHTPQPPCLGPCQGGLKARGPKVDRATRKPWWRNKTPSSRSQNKPASPFLAFLSLIYKQQQLRLTNTSSPSIQPSVNLHRVSLRVRYQASQPRLSLRHRRCRERVPVPCPA